MNQTFTTPEKALDAAYCSQPEDAVCEGYAPPKRFAHALRSRVGRYPSSHPFGLGSVLMEARYPASFYSADFEDSLGNFTFSIVTGSGFAMGVLLSDICEAFAGFNATLFSSRAPQEVGGHWRKVKEYIAIPMTERRDVDLYEHTGNAGWYQVAARPSGDGMDRRRRHGVCVYLQDGSLAERAALAFHEGMLTLDEHASSL